jgi:hypothetical protein
MKRNILIENLKDIIIFNVDLEKNNIFNDKNNLKLSELDLQLVHYIEWCKKEKRSTSFISYFSLNKRLNRRRVDITYNNSSNLELILNISSKVRIKDNLFDSSAEQIFTKLTKNIYILHIDNELNGYLLYSNNHAYTISNIGISPNIYTEILEQYSEELNRCLLTRTELELDISVKNQQTSAIDWSHVKLFPVLDSTGWVERWILFEKNINEEVSLNKELSSSQNALESLDIGIWKWDIVRNQLTWDEGMYKLYEIDREDFSGAYDAWRSCLHPEWVEKN